MAKDLPKLIIFLVASVIVIIAFLVGQNRSLAHRASVTPNREYQRVKHSVLNKDVPGLSFAGIQVGQTLDEIQASLKAGWSVMRDEGAFLVYGGNRKEMIHLFFDDAKRPKTVTSILGYSPAGLCYDQKLILPRIESPNSGLISLPNLTPIQHQYPKSRLTFLDPRDRREVTFEIMHKQISHIVLGWAGESWR